MRVITYHVTLLEPALVTALEGEPNSATAFDFLPGSVLRGAVIGTYLQRERSQNPAYQFDAANADVQRLFFNGSTRYLNGYPLDRLQNRCLPTPLSWKQHKKEAAQREPNNPPPIFDFAIEAEPGDVEEAQDVNAPFCWLSGDVRLKTPARHITVHTTRTRRFGRAMPVDKINPNENPGAVFRYDALAAGQTFEAVILCDRDEDASDLKALVSGEAAIGGSRSAGYGRVKFENVDESPGSWREGGGSLTYQTGDKLIVTLLSDALLRDDNGQFVVDSKTVKTALEKRLHCTLSQVRVFMRGRAIGGFNRKWGLLLPQTLAVRMGSVFVFEPVSCDVKTLRELEAIGIGERRAEGFGRVAINWNIEEELAIDPTPAERMARIDSPTSSELFSSLALSPESREVAQRMARRLLRQRLDEQVLAVANQHEVSNPPSRAQISHLRNIIHDELMQPAPKTRRIGEFLVSVKERSTARRQFERARISDKRQGGDKRFMDWIDETRKIATDEAWEDLFGLRGQKAQYLRSVGGVSPELTDALRDECLLRFLDAVLARVGRQNEG